MNDNERRDLFAAAALTGLLANDSSNGDKLTATCFYAYRIADRMLASTGRRDAASGNHPESPDSSPPVDALQNASPAAETVTPAEACAETFTVSGSDAAAAISMFARAAERLRAAAEINQAERHALDDCLRAASQYPAATLRCLRDRLGG